MIVTTATSKMSIQDMLKNIDQHKAWEIILDTYIERFRNKSCHFTSPFREDNHPGCCLKWFKGRIVFMDSGDTRLHGKDCIAALAILNNIPQYEAARQLYCETTTIPVIGQKHKVKKCDEVDFIFRMLYDFRKWSSIDNNRFNVLGLTKEDLIAEGWSPIKKISFNSREHPQGLTTFNTDGYIIKVGPYAKAYMPDRDSIRFLSTAPSHSVGGLSEVNFVLPLIVNKSAKDHVLVAKTGYNSRWIVNGEMDIPNDDFIKWALNFPEIYFLYDNDKAGITGSTRSALYCNGKTQTNKFRAIHLPIGEPKDPSAWKEKYRNIDIINKLISDDRKNRQKLEADPGPPLQGSTIYSDSNHAERHYSNMP